MLNKGVCRTQSTNTVGGRGLSVVHRLDTIKNYDQIAVVKSGRIVKIGKYRELLDKQGVLHELVSGKK